MDSSRTFGANLVTCSHGSHSLRQKQKHTQMLRVNIPKTT